MRKTATLWLGPALALGIVAGAAAGAQDRWEGRGFLHGHGDMERLHGDRLERITVFLDLSDQQVEEWRALHETRMAAFEAHREEMEVLHERIGELAEAERPDVAAVGELVIEAHRKRSAHQQERDAVHAEVLSILTPEQQERFEAMQSLHDRSDRGPKGRDRRPGRPGHSRHHGPSDLE